MTIRCHFDGKVFVPDEPVNAQVGWQVEVRIDPSPVEFTGGPGAPIGDLLKSDAIGGWSRFEDDIDSLELARELRRRASSSNYDKQRAFVDLHEHWDEQQRQREAEENQK
jgi:hypothetical protein